MMPFASGTKHIAAFDGQQQVAPTLYLAASMVVVMHNTHGTVLAQTRESAVVNQPGRYTMLKSL